MNYIKLINNLLFCSLEVSYHETLFKLELQNLTIDHWYASGEANRKWYNERPSQIVIQDIRGYYPFNWAKIKFLPQPTWATCQILTGNKIFHHSKLTIKQLAWAQTLEDLLNLVPQLPQQKTLHPNSSLVATLFNKFKFTPKITKQNSDSQFKHFLNIQV